MENKIILFQGDSITDADRLSENSQDKLGFGYPKFVKDLLEEQGKTNEFTIINRGISGNRIVDLLARWNLDCIELAPDILSILIGVNDVWHGEINKNGISTKLFRQVYDIILEETISRLPNVEIVLCTPFILKTGVPSANYGYWKPLVDEKIEVVKEMAKKYNTKIILFQDMFDEAVKTYKPEELLHDGVHPTELGHKIMRDKWLEVVCK